MSKSPKQPLAVTPIVIESRILIVRDQRVMLDSDLAEMYGVPTMRLNEQVGRNLDRFPEDFAFQLTADEFANLKSQNATSSASHGGRRKLPWVFTEHGVAMLSSVLKSPTATAVNIEIIRTFVRLRRLLATPGELVAIVMELAETVAFHEEQLKQIADVLNQMFAPPPDPEPKRRIGFHTPESK
jgi:ORF6N domain